MFATSEASYVNGYMFMRIYMYMGSVILEGEVANIPVCLPPQKLAFRIERGGKHTCMFAMSGI